jgi:indole-3-glycerol phosphate synthase
MEIARPSSASPAEDLAKLAQQYVAYGADALAVRIDAEDTPEGLKDLYVVCQAVKVPVLARDWVIHPLQVRGEAGAARVCCPLCAAELAAAVL